MWVVVCVSRFVHIGQFMKKLKDSSILVCGVGGQGVLTFSNILGWASIFEGLDVKLTEQKGLSQRGGSLISFVRIGEKVDYVFPVNGNIDILVALEMLEGLRWINMVDKNGLAIVALLEIPPVPCNLGIFEYPKNLKENYLKSLSNVIFVPTREIIIKHDLSYHCLNSVILGSLSAFLDISLNSFENAFKKIFRRDEDFKKNMIAFKLGRVFIENQENREKIPGWESSITSILP